MRRSLAASLAVLAFGCDPSPPPVAPMRAAPTEPLRPVEARGSVPEDARVADWVVSAALDAEAHRITATARLRFTNRGPRAIDRIPFRLALNGFRAEDTAWMKDGLLSPRTGRLDPEHPWGYTDVSRVLQHASHDGDAAPTDLRFAERDEPSLMDVWLAKPLEPGATAELELHFRSQLPRVYARTGFAGDFHMVGQWLPKPGVLDAEGNWHADPFTLHSEFFADFGRWEVELDVPATFVVGATGVRTEAWVDGDRRHERWTADMVHHFAWAAGPELLEQVDFHDGIQIRQLLPPDKKHAAGVHLEAQIAALDSMQTRFGPYPWSTITIVHPPRGAEAAGGMEYPTFFTTTERVDLPAWLGALGIRNRADGRYVTVHEFGHQYFQGLLASDEVARPWLDEGLNSMSNVLVYFDWFSDEPDPWIVQIAGQPLHITDGIRLRMREGVDLVPVDTPSAGFTSALEVYGPTVYTKPSAVMLTLRELVGHAAFDRAMARYTEKFRFRHPTGDDLVDTLVQELGARVAVSEPGPEPEHRVVELDVRDFLHRSLREASEVDYSVWDAGNHRRPGTAGLHRDEAGELVEDVALVDERPEDLPDDEVEGMAVIRRRGALWVPVEIEVELADGSIERRVWDGRATHHVLRFPGRRLVRVTIDPDRALLIESRRWNNTAYAPGTTPEFEVQHVAGDLGEAITSAILGGVGP